MEIVELPWQADPTHRFSVIAHRPWAILLDSCHDQSGGGRFDIFAADPIATVEVRDGLSTVTRHGRRHVQRGEPFAVLRELLGPPIDATTDVPFCGGAIGYFAYDLGLSAAGLTTHGIGYPTMALGIYDWAVVNDHAKERSFLINAERDPASAAACAWLAEHLAAPEPIAPPDYRLLAPLTAQMTEQEYTAAFGRVHDYIRAGDTYQVNLAQHFAAPSAGSLYAAYCDARVRNPAPYSAYFAHPEVSIASSSPECFLAVRDGHVETRPIKGTRRIGPDPAAERAELAGNPKDRAENLMIVDLLRNDLGKNCVPGSVAVPELFTVESFATVHQLISTVRGTLRNGRDAVHLLAGCFPGGSITGAPKRRAMEIIAELEPVPRGVYCGSLGYLGFDGAMETNIAIRTLVAHDGQTTFHAGGGLVADSQAAAEYQESLDKAAALRATLDAFRV